MWVGGGEGRNYHYAPKLVCEMHEINLPHVNHLIKIQVLKYFGPKKILCTEPLCTI